MEQLTTACAELLLQLETTIMSLTDEEFVRPSDALGGSSIGQHVRHTIEFFGCLAEGMASGVVNYDKRPRSNAIENDRREALSALRMIGQFVDPVEVNKDLTLEVCYRKETEEFCRIGTSYHRELAYNLEHAVHHMAIIRIAIRDVASQMELSTNFGVAASTIRFQTSGVNTSPADCAGALR